MKTLSIPTRNREGFVDITRAVREAVHDKGWRSGALLLFCPHTTAALTINEAADPSVTADMTAHLRTLVPRSQAFTHAEGNSDAHLKTTLIGPSLMLIVEDGEPRLGTWQGIYLFEGDGPRSRSVWLQFLPA